MNIDGETSNMATFVFIRAAMNDLVTTLGNVPLDALKYWITTVEAHEQPSAPMQHMQNGHIKIIKAYISMREYARASTHNDPKNN